MITFEDLELGTKLVHKDAKGNAVVALINIESDQIVVQGQLISKAVRFPYQKTFSLEEMNEHYRLEE